MRLFDRRPRVVYNYYSPVNYGRTLCHLLGIDPDKELDSTTNQPLNITIDNAPLIREVTA